MDVPSIVIQIKSPFMQRVYAAALNGFGSRCKSSHATDPRAFRSQALRNWRVAPPRRSVGCKELSAADFFSTLCKHFIYRV